MTNCGRCGFPTQDGRQFCPVCEGSSPNPDAFLPDGTPLYFKTSSEPTWSSVQLELYSMLFGYKKNTEED